MAEEVTADRSENQDSSMFPGLTETNSILLNVISYTLSTPLALLQFVFLHLESFENSIIFV